MNNAQTRELTCAITMQAVRDYFATGVTEKEQKTILRELRSKWMDYVTDGLSIIVAEQLENNPDEICERVRQQSNSEMKFS